MKEHNFEDKDLEPYWMGRVQNISTALGKNKKCIRKHSEVQGKIIGYKTMVWEETFRDKVPLKPETTVQVWKDFGEFKAALTVLNVSTNLDLRYKDLLFNIILNTIFFSL